MGSTIGCTDMLTDNFSSQRSPEPQPLSPSPRRTAVSALSYKPVSFLARLRDAAPSGASALDGLEALRQSAQRAISSPPQPFSPSGYAPPISPLRERDTAVLLEWFGRADMDDVESNLDRCLLSLWPEPCWEDDLTELLEEFL